MGNKNFRGVVEHIIFFTVGRPWLGRPGKGIEMRDINEILEDLDIAEITLDEIRGQFASEVALYGDGWPGAQIDIALAADVVQKLGLEYRNHPDYDPKPVELPDIEF